MDEHIQSQEEVLVIFRMLSEDIMIVSEDYRKYVLCPEGIILLFPEILRVMTFFEGDSYILHVFKTA